ncbi:MAG: hypothetical protein ACXVB9_12910 [Bdellovibrionota bacterium]
MGSKLNFLVLLLLCLALPGCVGGTLSDTSDFEMFPLRAASTSEGKELKRCLQAAHAAQDHAKKKTGHYMRKVRELPIDSYCSGFRMGQSGTPTGYEIRAEIHEDDTMVRWSVNEKGVIEEHLDPEGNADLEF